MLDILQDMITSGAFPPGARLPSERALAARFGVPQSQVHRTLQNLVAREVLECFRGSGYFPKATHRSSGKIHKIALCWEDMREESPSDDFYASLLFNLAPEYGINMTVFPFPMESGAQDRLLGKLIHDGFEGFFCFPHFVTELLPSFMEVYKRGLPLLFWDFSPFPGIFPAVGVDHFHSTLKAAQILSRQREPVTFVGFKGAVQNELKYTGFREGCKLYDVPVEREIFEEYEQFLQSGKVNFDADLQPDKLYFTSTRLLSTCLLGRMFDKGYLPGRDYRLLTMDRICFMAESTLKINSLMRDHTQIVRKLLSTMRDAVEIGNIPCHEWRYPMTYTPGNSLRNQ